MSSNNFEQVMVDGQYKSVQPSGGAGKQHTRAGSQVDNHNHQMPGMPYVA